MSNWFNWFDWRPGFKKLYYVTTNSFIRAIRCTMWRLPIPLSAQFVVLCDDYQFLYPRNSLYYVTTTNSFIRAIRCTMWRLPIRLSAQFVVLRDYSCTTWLPIRLVVIIGNIEQGFYLITLKNNPTANNRIKANMNNFSLFGSVPVTAKCKYRRWGSYSFLKDAQVEKYLHGWVKKQVWEASFWIKTEQYWWDH